MSDKIITDKIDKYLGLNFPLTNTQFGYFNPSILTKDQIAANVKNLILTRRGERLMRPNLGTDLYNIIFESVNNSSLEDQIDTYIRDSIKMWLPYVTVIEVKITGVGDNSVSIKLKYMTKEQIYEELTFSIIGE